MVASFVEETEFIMNTGWPSVQAELKKIIEVEAETVLDTFIEHLEEIQNARRTDSMGVNTIWYYPQIKTIDD